VRKSFIISKTAEVLALLEGEDQNPIKKLFGAGFEVLELRRD
jgi:hypothetical protein